MNDDFICADCKDESKKHMAKGLCSTCYMRKRNAEKAQAVQQPAEEEAKHDIELVPEPVKPEKCKKLPLSLTVEFIDDDEPLYHAIIASAKRQRRTVSNEVLFMIDQMTSRPETPKKIVPIAVGGRYF